MGQNQTFNPKKTIYWVWILGYIQTKPKLYLKFDSIHFGINTFTIFDKTFRIFDTQKCLGLKISDFFENS